MRCGEELGHAIPLLGSLAELAEARQRVEVLEVGLAHDLERADRAPRVVELLVEPRQARGDLPSLHRIGHELELALERVGGGREVLARFLQIGDGLERGAAGRIELGEDLLVARDGGVDVADPLGEELGLAQRDARLVRLVDRDVPEPPEERRRLGVVLALDGVVDELLERLAVVAVLEDLEPLLAGRLPCRRASSRRACAACVRSATRFDAIGQPVAALGEELDEVVPALVLRVAIDERASRTRPPSGRGRSPARDRWSARSGSPVLRKRSAARAIVLRLRPSDRRPGARAAPPRSPRAPSARPT